MRIHLDVRADPRRPARHRALRRTGPAAAALALLLGACTDAGIDDVEPGGEAAVRPVTAGEESIPDIVDRVQPSVVTVLTEAGGGSGVVYDEAGIVITNEHVVRGAESIELAYADGVQVPATVVATDPVVDVAVLQSERRGVPAAEFDTELPRVGATAIVIGSPLGFQETVTAGIISGLHRSIPGSARTTASLVDLIQTDAPISPGNSGGALVDAEGEVVGISEAYIPPVAGAVAIGFAIPAATVLDSVEELLADGQAEHAFLGLQPTTLTPALAAQFEIEADSGVVVLAVQPGGPADEAGIRPGDVLVEAAGEELATAEELLAVLRDTEPGRVLDLTVLREGDRRQVEVLLTDRPR